MAKKVEDRDLMLRYGRDRDVAAFEELVTRWEGRLLGFLRKTTGDLETAKDLRQDVLMRLSLYGHTYNPQYAFSTWLFRMVSNVLATWREKERTSQRRHLHLAVLGRNRSVEETPRDRAIHNEAMKEVSTAIERLTPEARELLLLRMDLELSYREISEILGAPETTIKSRFYRLLGEIRSAVTDADEPIPCQSGRPKM